MPGRDGPGDPPEDTGGDEGERAGENAQPRNRDAEADAFGLLADPTRLALLRALWAADGHRARFAELRAAVDVRDPGRLHYHLSALVGRFVARPEEGLYVLRPAGMDVVGSLLAGAYADAPDREPARTDEACPACGAALVVTLAEGWCELGCPACEHEPLVRLPAPGAVLAGEGDGDADDGDGGAGLATAATRYVRALFDQVTRGVCPFCRGRMTGELAVTAIAANPYAAAPDEPRRPYAEFGCQRCGESLQADLGLVVADHPAVVAFLHEHGVDAREAPLEQLVATGDDGAGPDADGRAAEQATGEGQEPARELLGRAPPRARVRLRAGDGTLAVTVGPDLTVEGVERA